MGADDWVAKPVRREEFLARVRSLLRVRRLLLEADQARATLAARNSELELKKTLAQTLGQLRSGEQGSVDRMVLESERRMAVAGFGHELVIAILEPRNQANPRAFAIRLEDARCVFAVGGNQNLT